MEENGIKNGNEFQCSDGASMVCVCVCACVCVCVCVCVRVRLEQKTSSSGQYYHLLTSL